MTTTVTKTIGTSGCDYSSIQAWYNAAPASLVTADQIWRGEIKQSGEWTHTGPALTCTGKTTDSTRYLELTTYAGYSFRDHADKATNPLRYNGSVGSGLKIGAAYTYVAFIALGAEDWHISNIQVRYEDPSVTTNALNFGDAVVTIDNCIFETTCSQSMLAAFWTAGGVVRNSVFIHRGGTSNIIGPGNVTFINCTIACPSDVSTPCANNLISAGAFTMKNCAMFGASAMLTAGGTPTYTNCYTDLGSPPSGCTQTTYSNAFETVVLSGNDYRLKSGSALIDTGTSSGAPSTDIVGKTRSAHDVGAWEYASVTAPQFLRPSTVISTGNWTPTSGTIAGVLDETVADDADYATTNDTASDTFEVKLVAGGDPASSSGHKVRYRIQGTGGAGVVVSLYQGATLIAGPWSHNPADASWTSYEQTLSSGEADAITNYGDLRLRFVSAP